MGSAVKSPSGVFLLTPTTCGKELACLQAEFAYVSLCNHSFFLDQHVSYRRARMSSLRRRCGPSAITAGGRSGGRGEPRGTRPGHKPRVVLSRRVRPEAEPAAGAQVGDENSGLLPCEKLPNELCVIQAGGSASHVGGQL